MIELTTFLILNFLGAFFTIFIIAFKTIPEEQDGSSWKGMAFISAIISTIIWLVCMVAVLDIGVIQPYAFISGSTVVTGSVTVH
jgi:hypothetical protein